MFQDYNAYFCGGSLELRAPSDQVLSIQRVEESCQNEDTSTEEPDAWLFRYINLWPDANSSDPVLEMNEPENNQLVSTSITNPLPNFRGRGDFFEPHSSVSQANGLATVSGFCGAPPIYGRLPSYPHQFMGQAVVASDPRVYSDQFTAMQGVNTSVAHFPMVGWHQSTYRRQPHAGASTPFYWANPPLDQDPVMAAFPVDELQSHESPATTSAQTGHGKKRHNTHRSSSLPNHLKISGKYCLWGDCSAGPMTRTKLLEHFRAHGEKVEGDKVKECQWEGCKPKPRAFPMTSDGFRRHVNETRSHKGIGDDTRVKCPTCGVKRSKRSMRNHRKICSGKSKELESKGKKQRD